MIQFFLAGLGAFETVHDKKFNDNNFGPHGILGTLLVLVALVIMVLALIGRWTPSTTKLSAALFGLMVIQLILGVSGAGTSPILGGLHAVNALADRRRHLPARQRRATPNPNTPTVHRIAGAMVGRWRGRRSRIWFQSRKWFGASRTRRRPDRWFSRRTLIRACAGRRGNPLVPVAP